MSGGLEADLDLTDAVEAAARTWWEQRRGPAHAPWEDLVKSDPRLAQAVRKDARPMVTAAAPIIATAALTRAHAEVEKLRVERERHGLANDGCVPGAAYRDLAAAHADLRAGIERIADECAADIPADPGNATARHIAHLLRAVLDGPDERSGGTPSVDDMAGALGPDWTGGLSSVDFVRSQRDDHPAPVVPDSADVRERVWQALRESRRTGLGGMTETQALDHMTDAVLAAAGQDMTAEQAVTADDLDRLPVGSVVMTVTPRPFGAYEQRVWQRFGGEPDWQFGHPRHDWQSADGGFVRMGNPASTLVFNREFHVLYRPDPAVGRSGQQGGEGRG